ncbi:hypothetical protein F5884DRAFT_278021 [Xylogone sp. PMI_703]|nr:hypothetical protein F5884DRAFT_278021 [Xylogone sp. PMI_703]
MDGDMFLNHPLCTPNLVSYISFFHPSHCTVFLLTFPPGKIEHPASIKLQGPGPIQIALLGSRWIQWTGWTASYPGTPLRPALAHARSARHARCWVQLVEQEMVERGRGVVKDAMLQQEQRQMLVLINGHAVSGQSEEKGRGERRVSLAYAVDTLMDTPLLNSPHSQFSSQYNKSIKIIIACSKQEKKTPTYFMSYPTVSKTSRCA